MNSFYCGCHQPSDAKRFEYSFVSVNRLRERKGWFKAFGWVLDSGAFTEITRHGRHRYTPQQYAAQIRKWSGVGNLHAAVSQDWMCEPEVIAKTGLSIERHQELTIENYRALKACDTAGIDVMPVIQGRTPDDYVRHIKDYGDDLKDCHWVGIGSVCGRTDISEIEDVVTAVSEHVPSQTCLHGFGVKLLAFASEVVADLLFSADSQAWSLAARWGGRNQNCWTEAAKFVEKINKLIGSMVCEVYYPKHTQTKLFSLDVSQ